MKPIQYAEKIRRILHLTIKEYYGTSRKQPLAWKRQVAMHLTYQNTNATLEEVRRIFCKTCYTTVLWAGKVVINRIEQDDRDRRYVDNLERCAAKL